jgi:ankyrin repeat protein
MSRFRWVALQLDAASRCRSLNALHDALSSLPPSLDETYRRILESIEEQEGHVRRILQWLCFSRRPLRLEEIEVIYQIADRIQPPFIHEDELFHPEDIIGIFRGLLSLSSLDTHQWHDDEWCHFPSYSRLQIVQLAHFSVKEYLFSSLSSPWTINEDLSHATILKSAVAYYLHFMTLRDIQFLSGPDLTLRYSLAEYCAVYLQHHFTLVGEHSDVLQSLRLLLHPPSAPFATKFGRLLLDRHDQRHRDWDDPIDKNVARDPATILCLAIRLQLPQVCQSLLATNVQLDLAKPLFNRHKPPLGDPPLVEAVQCGGREIIQVLLDTRAKHHYYGLDPLADGSALEKAVKEHDTHVVQMLLDAADDIRETVSRFGKSLQVASAAGHEGVVRMLIVAGADVNRKYDGETALEAASRSGHAKIVSMLLDAGADHGYALYYSSVQGYEDVVCILIGAGANVNIQCDGKTALEAASRSGHAKIVSMLLDAGADHGYALYHSSVRGYEDVVCILIGAGADVNKKCYGETALESALHSGHTKVVKMLLDAGAYDDYTLHEASSKGYEDFVRILIRAGANVNTESRGETALKAASRSGHAKIVKILLDAGAYDDYALNEASGKGQEDVVRILIGAGANVNMEHHGKTALETASYCGHAKVVKTLLDAGADVDGQSLYFASRWGHEEVVRLLIEGGTDVNLKFAGQTAIDRAMHYGHAAVVDMLLHAGRRSRIDSRIQNHSHPSRVVGQDNNDKNPETEEREGQIEDDDENEETEVKDREDDDSEREDTEEEEEEEEAGNEEGRKKRKKSGKNYHTGNKRRKGASESVSRSCES